jgi:uncharacterized protein YndB with AHSA1/START domain
MTTTIETTAVHSTFRLERAYRASPARVFRAFAETEAKRRWFIEGEGWEVYDYTADFRVGGREYSRFSFRGGPAIENETVYLDLVPDARLVFAYRMATEGKGPMSASLTTIELVPQDGGTLLVQTEQGAYLDGSDDGTHREEGWRELLDRLAREVEG